MATPYRKGQVLHSVFAAAKPHGGEQMALWVHGHSPTAVDYDVAGAHVVCNPSWYPGEEAGFHPDLIITI